jgi:serine/threonine protein kinase
MHKLIKDPEEMST